MGGHRLELCRRALIGQEPGQNWEQRAALGWAVSENEWSNSIGRAALNWKGFL